MAPRTCPSCCLRGRDEVVGDGEDHQAAHRLVELRRMHREHVLAGLDQVQRRTARATGVLPMGKRMPMALVVSLP